MSNPLNILLDTNVWLDMYDPRRPYFNDAIALLNETRDHDVELYYTATSMKDVFFITANSYKRTIKIGNGSLYENDALAVNEMAWGCIQNMYDIGAPIPVTTPILSDALKLKGVHFDFEDDVILAAAQIGHVDFLVTNDKALITKSTVPTLSAKDMLAYLQMN